MKNILYEQIAILLTYEGNDETWNVIEHSFTNPYERTEARGVFFELGGKMPERS